MVILPTFRTLNGWAKSIDDLLSAETSRVRTPTVELGVKAILSHIQSFFGGDLYQPACEQDNVIITPPGAFGLLAKDHFWTALAPIP